MISIILKIEYPNIGMLYYIMKKHDLHLHHPFPSPSPSLFPSLFPFLIPLVVTTTTTTTTATIAIVAIELLLLKYGIKFTHLEISFQLSIKQIIGS